MRQEEEKHAATILSALRGKIGREEMELLNVLQAPLSSLVGVLSAAPRNLANVLDQVAKQRESRQA